jgi:hypothetical protein
VMSGALTREWEGFVQSGAIHEGLTAFDVHEARRLYFCGAAGFLRALETLANDSSGDVAALLEAVQTLNDEVMAFGAQIEVGHA